MAYCSNCGYQLEENAKFCPACGTKAEASAETFEATATEIPAPVESVIETPAPAKASGVLNMPMLIWAIINLIYCMPLGIAGLVLTIMAKDAPSETEEAKKLKTAKTCNIIGSIGGVIYILICFVLGVIIGLAEYL